MIWAHNQYTSNFVKHEGLGKFKFILKSSDLCKVHKENSLMTISTNDSIGHDL